jgi:hypothetical protein
MSLINILAMTGNNSDSRQISSLAALYFEYSILYIVYDHDVTT